MNSRTCFRRLSPATLALLFALTGCHGGVALPTPEHEAASAQKQAEINSQRTDLEGIPPPSKSRYMAIHDLDSWENPYLTVQPGMVTLHVLLADANPMATGAGGMMRPLNARKQDLNVAVDKLGDALDSIPHSAWPYGRVVAVEEAHKTPASALPEVRRNTEATMKTLNDLGMVVYEWSETGPR